LWLFCREQGKDDYSRRILSTFAILTTVVGV
jgi:hypothetical protein